MAVDNQEAADLSKDAGTARESLTRENLYNLVWSEPMLKIAARFGVSSSYMARVCSQLNVPRPQRGYWAKLEVGKAPKKPLLPEARPGDELIWRRDGDAPSVARSLPKPPTRAVRKLAIPTLQSHMHPLVDGAKGLFESGRLSYESGYLKPAKKLLIDLAVAKTGLDKALGFANQFFLALETAGHRVVIATQNEYLHREEVDEREERTRNRGYSNLWSPARCTVVYIGTVAIGLTIIEVSEEVLMRYVGGKYIPDSEYVAPKRGRYTADHTWTTQKDIPSGKLCLQAYSPYAGAKWVRHWRETKDRDLVDQIPKIVKELEREIAELARLVEEGERQALVERQKWEAQTELWRQEEVDRRTAEAIQESKKALLQIIEDWAETVRIEQFFTIMEGQATKLDPEDCQLVLERLERGRKLLTSDNCVERLKQWEAPEDKQHGIL